MMVHSQPQQQQQIDKIHACATYVRVPPDVTSGRDGVCGDICDRSRGAVQTTRVSGKRVKGEGRQGGDGTNNSDDIEINNMEDMGGMCVCAFRMMMMGMMWGMMVCV